jgi:membrane fusion protein (multidrug efflux system)
VKRKALIALPIAVVLLVAGAGFWHWQRGHETTDDAEVDAHIAALSARVAGTVTAVHVQENDVVARGTLLAELDPRDYQVALQRAEAELALARANHTKAAHDLTRYRYLVGQRVVPRMQYDEKFAAESADQAAIAAARAAVERARLDLQYTKIFAPTDGIVGRRGAEVGQQVQPGQELFAFVQSGDVWITAYFKETQLKKMQPGLRARVHVDALGRDYSGTVESLGAASGARFSLLPPENATGNFVKVVQRIPVRIRLQGRQSQLERLRPGMSVEPKVYLR